MILALDVDEVVLDMIPEWLRRYNEKYGDSVRPEDVDRWDFTQVCPKAGARVYDLLREPGFYSRVEPVPGALEDVQRARSLGMRVVFVSSCVVGTVDDKVRRLIDTGFLPDTKNQRNFFAATDKTLVNADVLVDDNVDNVEAWAATGRRAFLKDHPHNRSRKTPVPRVGTIYEALKRLDLRVALGTK